jgi:crossover junction endodeoxyribonuclease RuvC
MRVLGIDTSLRSTGYAVVAAQGQRLTAVEYGAVRIPDKEPHSECLRRLNEAVADVVRRTAPEAAAIEGAFYCKNARTAMILGEARGVVIAACAGQSIPIYEYEPRRVKQAIVGFGGASKEQVRHMVMRMLGLSEEPQEDAGDALAMAICHLHNSSRHALLQSKAI